MRKIICVIEKSADGGFGIYATGVDGLFGYGLTEKEAKESICEAAESQKEFYAEKGLPVPEELNDPEFDYRYDLSAFFEIYPFFNASEFAKAVGINPSLMRRYKNKLAFASAKQKAVIQEKYSELVKSMSAVQF
jgi:predicted RNase H-like HicB family nuclease